MSFLGKDAGAQYRSEDPEDDEYQKVEYDDEISDDDDRAHEGLLRQEDQPRAPVKKSYFQTLADMIKPGVKEGPAQVPARDHLGPYRRLLSDDSLDSLSPNIAASYGRAMTELSKSVKARTNDNIKALEALLAKVPAGQAGLNDHIAGILAKERLNHRELETMVNYSEQLKEGKFNVRNGMMSMSANTKGTKK